MECARRVPSGRSSTLGISQILSLSFKATTRRRQGSNAYEGPFPSSTTQPVGKTVDAGTHENLANMPIEEARRGTVDGSETRLLRRHLKALAFERTSFGVEVVRQLAERLER